jgi:hypothetical protein
MARKSLSRWDEIAEESKKGAFVPHRIKGYVAWLLKPASVILESEESKEPVKES